MKKKKSHIKKGSFGNDELEKINGLMMDEDMEQ